MSLDKKDETKNIQAVLILEVIGRPPEHLVKTLEGMINTIDEEKGVSVKRKKINEPNLMEEKKNLYMTFAEIEIEVEDISYLVMLMFKYMPAHIEILEPPLIALTNNGWTDILSEITRKLHGYDEIAMVLQFKNAELQKKINENLENIKENKEEKKSENKKIREKKKK